MGRLNVDPLAVGVILANFVPAGNMAFRDIDTFLGWAGLRIGTSFTGDSYIVQPFIGANRYCENSQMTPR